MLKQIITLVLFFIGINAHADNVSCEATVVKNACSENCITTIKLEQPDMIRRYDLDRLRWLEGNVDGFVFMTWHFPNDIGSDRGLQINLSVRNSDLQLTSTLYLSRKEKAIASFEVGDNKAVIRCNQNYINL